jgi:hypothetical protein
MLRTPQGGTTGRYAYLDNDLLQRALEAIAVGAAAGMGLRSQGARTASLRGRSRRTTAETYLLAGYSEAAELYLDRAIIL